VCSSIDIDTGYSENITPADRNLIEKVLHFFSGYEHYKTLTGSYDDEDIFSPMTKSLCIYVYYPEGYTSADYVAENELSQLFSADVTGDISVKVNLKAPDSAPQYWYRLSSTDLASN
jgi:hypothetical protein